MIFAFLHFLADKDVLPLLFIHQDDEFCNYVGFTNN